MQIVHVRRTEIDLKNNFEINQLFKSRGLKRSHRVFNVNALRVPSYKRQNECESIKIPFLCDLFAIRAISTTIINACLNA